MFTHAEAGADVRHQGLAGSKGRRISSSGKGVYLAVRLVKTQYGEKRHQYKGCPAHFSEVLIPYNCALLSIDGEQLQLEQGEQVQ